MSKNDKNTRGRLPGFLKNPFYPACVMAVLDILALAAAIVYRQLREGLTEYYFSDDKIIAVNPVDSYGGAVLAVLLGISAITAAMMIAGVVLKADRWDKSPIGGVFGSLAMLAVSVGVIFFALYFARGQQPQKTLFTEYVDDGTSVVVSEERYRSGAVLKVYQVFDDGCAVLCAQTALAVPTEVSLESRFAVAGANGRVVVTFADGETYRNIAFELREDEC